MPEENNEKRTLNPKTKKLIITVACIFVIAAIATTAIIIALSHRENVGDVLALGDRYMSEMDYESAIREYRHAIEIDPKSEDAYIKLSEAYIAMGDIDSAIKALEEGYEATQSERILERLNELRGEETDDETTDSNQTDAVTTTFSETDAPPQEADVPVPERMIVETAPHKVTYYVGDTLDLTGLTLTVMYSDGTTEEISDGYTCDVEILNDAGTVEVTVIYEDVRTTFEVTVEELTIAKDFSWALENGVLTLNGHGLMPDFSHYDDFEIVYVDAPWYGRRNEIEKVFINDGILNIGDCAFYDCTVLTSVTIADSVSSIGSFAFSGCDSLTSITIPDSVISIDEGVFSGCINLMSVSLPSKLLSISDFSFTSCFSLESVVINSSVKNIGIAAFAFCESLSELSISESVVSIGDDAFVGCDCLTIITPQGTFAEQYAKKNGIPFASN